MTVGLAICWGSLPLSLARSIHPSIHRSFPPSLPFAPLHSAPLPSRPLSSLLPFPSNCSLSLPPPPSLILAQRTFAHSPVHSHSFSLVCLCLSLSITHASAVCECEVGLCVSPWLVRAGDEWGASVSDAEWKAISDGAVTSMEVGEGIARPRIGGEVGRSSLSQGGGGRLLGEVTPADEADLVDDEQFFGGDEPIEEVVEGPMEVEEFNVVERLATIQVNRAPTPLAISARAPFTISFHVVDRFAPPNHPVLPAFLSSPFASLIPSQHNNSITPIPSYQLHPLHSIPLHPNRSHPIPYQ